MKKTTTVSMLGVLLFGGCGDTEPTASVEPTPAPKTTARSEPACDQPEGLVLAAVKSSAGGVDIDKSAQVKSGKTTFVAAKTGGTVLLVSFKDDAEYLSGMRAVNGTARSQTDLKESSLDVVPAAGERALACVEE